MMDIMVFAGLKEKIGGTHITLDIKNEPTVKELKETVYRQYPALEGDVFQVACNESFVKDTHILSKTDEVALIPPVSGG
ncbi:molybdopterin converting factor subunit 1 [Salinicoccus siamensis]|uniref:Molybdopterin synthase sulfur carrier subunit n=2 Tax=Salinicoccus siamensis TaxID=381830 RepID=A0ABV5Z0K1_9STAP